MKLFNISTIIANLGNTRNAGVHRGINLPSKRLLIGATSALFGIFVLWWLLLWISFSEESVSKKTQIALEQLLGSKVNFGEDIRFSLLPFPTLTVNNLSVENHKRSRQPSMLKVAQMVVEVSPYSIISGGLYTSLKLHYPRLELEVFDDGSSSWQRDYQAEEAEAATIIGVEIIGGEIHYNYPAVKQNATVKEIYSQLNFSGENEFQSYGEAMIAGAYYQYDLNMRAESDERSQLSVAVSDGVSTLSTEGIWESSKARFEGKQRFETVDLGALLHNFAGEFAETQQNNAVMPEPQNNTGQEVAKEMPLEWDSEVIFEQGNLHIRNMNFSGKYVQGKGEISVAISNIPEITTRMDFEKLSLDPLIERGIISKLLTQSDSTEIGKGLRGDLQEGKKTTLPLGIQLALTITAKEMLLLSVPLVDFQMAMKMEQGMISLSQLNGKLPGDSQFIIKGEIEGSYEGLALKGQLDVAGKQFTKIYQALLGNALDLPERLKQFRGRANLFLTPSLIRLSELILRVEDIQILGTILKQTRKIEPANGLRPIAAPVTQESSALAPEKEYTNYEGAIRIDNINFDELQQSQKEAAEAENLADYPKVMRVAQKWQTQIDSSVVDLKLSFLNAIFNEKKIAKISSNLLVDRGGVALNNLELPYNGTLISGNVGISFLPQAIPFIKADIKADLLNTTQFFEYDFNNDEAFWDDKIEEWSRKEFNLEWMKKINADINILIGSLTHKVHELQTVTASLSIKDSALQLGKLTAGIWGGELFARGQVLASKLPSLSGNVSLRGIAIEKLRSATDLVGDLMGRLSLSAQFSTTGLNPYTAMQNAQGVIAIAGRGITITGFNLANMVRAANSVRTVSDIEKLVNFANQGGTTSVDTMQGNINLGGGYLRSPGILITTKEGSGSINGQLNLMDWTLNTAISIYLSSLQKQSPPFIRLVFVGPLNQATRSLDTQSLESFIAKQAAERILDTN